jgi:hypothetical protein
MSLRGARRGADLAAVARGASVMRIAPSGWKGPRSAPWKEAPSAPRSHAPSAPSTTPRPSEPALAGLEPAARGQAPSRSGGQAPSSRAMSSFRS